jgi:hypothetical protein
MMTKWDTIQADVADAYRHLDDVVDVEDSDSIFDDELISLDELENDELVLDWEGLE